MPVALTDQGARAWLAEGTSHSELLTRLDAGMFSDYEFWPVSTAVNNPTNREARVAAPISRAELAMPTVTVRPNLTCR